MQRFLKKSADMRRFSQAFTEQPARIGQRSDFAGSFLSDVENMFPFIPPR